MEAWWWLIFIFTILLCILSTLKSLFNFTICYGLALLHLEYFVANFVWNFEWKAIDEVGVDLSEKQEFIVVMRNPLLARITPRAKMT
ncbi:unnamed protein product [Coffea canephora]|uniref:Uncharacterized protein n=1 Tax=Coffea canephora TaxID=49390 RepID=A0A068VEU7_COFCA|nr:unnamed protein product [Coffea canephora]